MPTLRVLVIACSVTCLAIAGCASGGGEHTFPTHPSDAPAAINRASSLISDAAAAGADSLAPEQMKSARQLLGDAQTERHGPQRDRAPMTAKLAGAQAVYAKALAQCVLAERTLAAEEAALAAVAASPATKSAKP